MNTPRLVTDTAAADFLTSPNTRYLLGPFLQGEVTVSEAATMLGGIKLSTFYRRVKQMLALELIEVVRTESRSGHRVKLYRTVQPEFIVPLEATSSVNLGSYLDALLQGSISTVSRGMTKEMQTQTPYWGFRIYPASRGSAWQKIVPLDARSELRQLESASERSMYGDCGVRLDHNDAQAFKRELKALYDKYLSLAKNEGEGEWYFLALGFTPT